MNEQLLSSSRTLARLDAEVVTPPGSRVAWSPGEHGPRASQLFFERFDHVYKVDVE